MKTQITCGVAFLLSYLFVSAQIQAFDPLNFTPGNEYLIAGWNFNWNQGDTQFQKRETQRTVSHGFGTMIDNFTVPLNVPNESNDINSGLATNGSSDNLFGDDVAGQSLNILNGSGSDPDANLGGWFQFQLNFESFENVSLSYVGRRNNTDSIEGNQWSYSVDGGEIFTNINVPLVNPIGSENFSTFTLDLPDSVDGIASVIIRNTLVDSSPPTNNLRFNLYDNLQFTGTAVPEPRFYAMITGLGVLILAFFRRKTKCS